MRHGRTAPRHRGHGCGCCCCGPERHEPERLEGRRGIAEKLERIEQRLEALERDE